MSAEGSLVVKDSQASARPIIAQLLWIRVSAKLVKCNKYATNIVPSLTISKTGLSSDFP